MPVSLEQFTKQVAQSGLMSADDVTALVASLPPARQVKDAEGLARELVKQKKLTTFQAQEIYAGRGKHLVLGNYVVLDKLGQGGMGMVLKAEHRRMKRPVALKVLSPAVTKTPEALRRFQREVEAAAKLRHMNIVAADDADEAGGIHFLVMEYVEGSDLSALVKRSGPLALDRALHCIIQAARGLEYAHARGVVHRDIKPSNLLLDQTGTIKILDMGLARLQSGGPEQDELTGTGQIMGTVDYMAPEQAMSTKNVDARADIYSLGITLWYLLSAHPMYDGETAIAKLMAHQSNPIPSLAEYCPIVTPQLQAAFEKMVAKRPADRYQSMTEVIAALEPFRGLGAAAATISSHASEDPQLAALLRGSQQPGSSGAALAAKNVAAKSAAVDVTIDSGLRKADTDPQTQISLPIPLTRTLQPAATRPVARAAAVAKQQQPVKLIAAGVAAVIVLSAALVWAIVGRGPKEPLPESPASPSAEAPGPVARIQVPSDGGVAVVPGHEPAAEPVKPAPPLAKPEPPSSAPPITLTPPELAASSPWRVIDAQRILPSDLGVTFPVHPHVSADGLALVFAHAGNVEANLMISTRPAVTSRWNRAIPLTELNSGAQDSHASITEAQLRVIFFSNRDGDHLWSATRPQASDRFSPPVDLGPMVNKPSVRSWYPSISAQGRWLTYVQEVSPGVNKAFLGDWRGASRGPMEVRELGPEIDALGYCRGATVTDDGLTLAADMGQQELGQSSSLWSASRANTTSPFTDLKLIGEFAASAGKNILNPTLSGDGQTLWFVHQGGLVRCEKGSQASASTSGDGSIFAKLTSPQNWWTEPENLGPGVNSDASEYGPTLTSDGLNLVFARVGGKGDLYESRRGRTAAEFGQAMPILELNTPEIETDPCLSSDGLTLIFSANTGPDAQGDVDLYQSERATRTAAWGPRVNLGPLVNSDKSETSASLSPDGLTMFFQSSRGGQSVGIWRSRRKSTRSAWEEPIDLGSPVNTPAPEEHPDLAADGQTLLFGRREQNVTDLFVARQGSDGQWRVAPLELAGDDAEPKTRRHPTLSPMDGTLYFSSPRAGGLGSSDLWMTRQVRK